MIKHLELQTESGQKYVPYPMISYIDKQVTKKMVKNEETGEEEEVAEVSIDVVTMDGAKHTVTDLQTITHFFQTYTHYLDARG